MLTVTQATFQKLQALNVDQNPSNVAAGYKLVAADLAS